MKTKEALLQGERLDQIGFGSLKLIQKPEEFCYGVDAVILSDFVTVKNRGRVIDLGTGTGIIPLILSHKTDAAEIIGAELQEGTFLRAQRNILLNGLGERIRMIHADINDISDLGSFDAVVTNPPYVKRGGGLRNTNQAKMIARHEITAELEDFVKCAARLLKNRGDFFMVHRPDRLVDISCACRAFSLEPKSMRFVSADQHAKPNILLIHCVKNGRPELKLMEPLYVYGEDGKYSDEILRIYEK